MANKAVWGIDASKTSIKACKLINNKGIPRITDVSILPYRYGKKKVSEEEQNVLYLQALTNLVKSAKIGRDPVYISLPTHAIFNRIVKLPVDFDDPKFEQMVNYETASQIPFPVEQVTWNYLKVERDYKPGEENEVVILAIKKDVVENFLEIIRPADLNVHGVQISPYALYNFLRFDLGELDHSLIVDIGADNASLIVSESDRLWIRNLPVTGNDITVAIQEKLNVPYEKAEKLKVSCSTKPDKSIYQIMQSVYNNVVGEVHRSIGFYKTSSRDAKFEKLVLVGQASRSYGLRQYLGKALQLDAVRVQRIHNIEVSGSVAQELLGENISSIGVSIGLALEGLGFNKQKVNLLPGNVVEELELSKQKPWYIAAAALFVVFAFILYLKFSSSNNHLKNQLSVIEEQIDQLSTNKRKFAKVRGKGDNSLDAIVDHMDTLFNVGRDRNRVIKQYLHHLGKLPAATEERRFDKRIWLLSSICYSKFKADTGRRTRLLDEDVIVIEFEVAISKYKGAMLEDIINSDTMDIKSDLQSQNDIRKELEKLFPEDVNLKVDPQPIELVLPDISYKTTSVKSLFPRLFYLFKILIEIEDVKKEY